MTRFGTAIADHLASQGATGLQLADGRSFTLDQLRSLSANEPGFDREQAWAIAHAGERIRRPRGRTVYTVDGYEQAATSFGPSWLIRLRKDDGAFVCVGYTETAGMVPEDAPVPPPAAQKVDRATGREYAAREYAARERAARYRAARHCDTPSPEGDGFTVCEQPEHMHIARAAEAMAAAIDVMCHRRLLDARSFPADARLMLGDPWPEAEAIEILKRYRPHAP